METEASKSARITSELKKFSKFQVLQYVLICVSLAFMSMCTVNYIFVAEDIDFRCRVPECESQQPKAAVPPWWPHGGGECSKPVLNSTIQEPDTCTNASFLPGQWTECHDWIYESNHTIVSYFNLACQSWKAKLIGSVHNAAMIPSTILGGWLSDRYGRRFTFILFSVGGSIGLLKIIAPNYYLFLVLEFLESFFSTGLMPVGIVLLIEIANESMRVNAGVLFGMALDCGELMFSLFAMVLKYWKYVVAIIYAPMLLFISYVWILHESIRWQILNGKTEEAKATFQSMRKMNNLDVTSKEIDELSEKKMRLMFTEETTVQKESFARLIQSSEMMKRFWVLAVCFFSSAFIFSGLSVYSVELPGDSYVNYILKVVSALPGDVISLYGLNKYGRKLTLQVGYVSSALFIIGQAYTPEDLAWLKILLFLLGNFTCIVCYTAIFTYVAELSPTSTRGLMVGCTQTIAMVGNTLGPMTPLLEAQWRVLPSVLFSMSAGLSGILLTLVPETKGEPIFDTISQAEAHAKKIVSRL